MITTVANKSAVRAMHAGLALTVAATLAPCVDRATTNVLADHIRSGYPGYPPARIDTAVTSYLIILSVVGVLGVGVWLGTIKAVQRDSRWARKAALGAFGGGLVIAATALSVRDTSGDLGLAPVFGLLQLAPCVAGAIALALLWRHDRSAAFR
jgi:hypothetical protein